MGITESTMIPSVQIYCDGSKTIGYGHISRSLVLYRYLLSKNIEVSIFGLTSEANEFLKTTAKDDQDAEIVVFDSNSEVLNDLFPKFRNKTIITLDWFGKATPDINIVVYPHSNVRARMSKYMGFEYIIIKNDITKRKNSIKRKNSALVCIGGGDILNQGIQAAEILSKQGMNVTLVKGPTNNKEYSSSQFEVLIQPDNFNYLLSTSNIVVTNGGGCMFESIYLEQLTFSLPQTVFESNIAKYAFKKSSLLGIGLQSIKDIDPEVVNNYKLAQNNLIDGKGVNRIYKIIKSSK